MELLFDIPWYLPAGVAAAGIALFIWANARLRKRERSAGLGLIGLAILLTVISYFVDTPRELVEKRTRAFVDAVIARDRAAIDVLVAEDATAYSWGKQEILDGAIYYADQTDLQGARIIRLDGVKEGNGLVSYLTVWSQHGGKSAMPITDLNSQWKLEWIEDRGAWKIVEIVPLQIGQISREAIERTYLDRPAPATPRR